MPTRSRRTYFVFGSWRKRIALWFSLLWTAAKEKNQTRKRRKNLKQNRFNHGTGDQQWFEQILAASLIAKIVIGLVSCVSNEFTLPSVEEESSSLMRSLSGKSLARSLLMRSLSGKSPFLKIWSDEVCIYGVVQEATRTAAPRSIII